MPYRGSFIANITQSDVLDVLAVRMQLEPYAIAESMAHAPADLAVGLEKLLRTMESAGAAQDQVEITAAHSRFHALFYQESGNQLLGRLWGKLEFPIRLFLPQSPVWHIDDLPRLHEGLVNRVRAGDVPGAKKEALRHLRMTNDAVWRAAHIYDDPDLAPTNVEQSPGAVAFT